MISQTDIRTFLELQPIVPTSHWWQLLILLVAFFAMTVFIFWMCRSDSRDLAGGLTTLLTTLRLVVLICILIYVLNPGKRTETRIVKTSRLAILVDTSLSMGLKDQHSSGESLAESPRRIDQVTTWLGQTPEFELLRQEHDLSFYRFGDQSQPESIANLNKLGSSEIETPITEQNQARLKSDLRNSRFTGLFGAVILILAIVLLVIWTMGQFSGGRGKQTQANLLCGGVLVLMVSLATFACSDLGTPRFAVNSSQSNIN